jgi:aminopeptidase
MTFAGRWTELAARVADGTKVADGSKVSVFLTSEEALPAAEAFVAECYRRGALPQVVLSDERFDRHALRHASIEVLADPDPLEAWSMEWADVHVSFRGMAPPVDEPVDADRLAAQRQGKGRVSTLRWQHTRWALVRVPTPAWSAMIGADHDTVLTEFFDGCLADWAAYRDRWQRLADDLAGEEVAHIQSEDTDLRLPVQGRRWVVFAGENNFPDGELATAPVETAVEGHITFPGRFWFAGAAISDLRLEFTEGLVSRVDATEGADVARKLLTMDAGAGRVGELGIGLNPEVRTLTGDLLIDEKILGTVHIALGRAYPECGGVNESSLHWDIVKDLRVPSGNLAVGRVQIIRDGRAVDL